MLSENTLFSVCDNIKQKHILITKYIFLIFFLQNRKLFSKTVIK